MGFGGFIRDSIRGGCFVGLRFRGAEVGGREEREREEERARQFPEISGGILWGFVKMEMILYTEVEMV